MNSRDIEFQAPVEMQIAYAIARRYEGATILPNAPGKNSLQDFKLFRPFGIEVKCDYKAKETGNLFFETFNSFQGKPSGLTATKAWRWAHYLPGAAKMFVYPPADMLSHCKSSSWRFIERGGDNNSDGYLGPISEVESLGFVTQIEIML